MNTAHRANMIVTRNILKHHRKIVMMISVIVRDRRMKMKKEEI